MIYLPTVEPNRPGGRNERRRERMTDERYERTRVRRLSGYVWPGRAVLRRLGAVFTNRPIGTVGACERGNVATALVKILRMAEQLSCADDSGYQNRWAGSRWRAERPSRQNVFYFEWNPIENILNVFVRVEQDRTVGLKNFETVCNIFCGAYASRSSNIHFMVPNNCFSVQIIIYVTQITSGHSMRLAYFLLLFILFLLNTNLKCVWIYYVENGTNILILVIPETNHV